MKLIRITCAAAVLASMAALAILAQQLPTSGGAMVGAARDFLGGLSDEQKKQATFDFDSPERTRWWFTPRQDNATRTSTRKGLPLEAMSPAQKKAALALVKAGTSDAGNLAAVTIMSLEAILA